MKSAQSHVIYVGKAKNLRSRVRSYFQSPEGLSPKTAHLMLHVDSLEFLLTPTEAEALVLENALIKKFKPKYNIRLKDDKTYPYLKMDMGHDFPRPYLVRKKTLAPGEQALFYGPFTHGGAMSTLLGVSGRIFQIRDCRDTEFANRSRPCLTYEIGHCTAPCVGKVSQAEYGVQVQDYLDFLGGSLDGVQSKWTEEMEIASEKMEFERAAKLRDRISQIGEILKDSKPRVESSDLVDRDFWMGLPNSDSNAFSQLFGAFQFRGGKWMGQIPYEVDLENSLTEEGEEGILKSLLFHHYSKNPLPAEIVLPLTLKFTEATSLSEALIQVVPKTEAEGAPQEGFQISTIDKKGEWLRLSELFVQNLNEIWEEKSRLALKRMEGLGEIARLVDLPRPPRRMECIDISNFQGEGNVASCVVFVDGKPFKDHYRRYHIRSFEGQNDFASMDEVISRRYGKQPDEAYPLPDLLVVDGGKGQLSVVVSVLESLGVKIPVVALAKARTQGSFKDSEVEASEERIFKPGQKNPLKIRDPKALQILTRIRDEAHRFAIEFNRLTLERKRGL